MPVQAKALPALRTSQTAIAGLKSQLAQARTRAAASRRAAELAKAEFKRARKSFKHARKAAKEMRRQAKALKREIAQMTLAAARAVASRRKQAAGVRAKMPAGAVRPGRKRKVTTVDPARTAAVPEILAETKSTELASLVKKEASPDPLLPRAGDPGAV